MGFFTAAGGPLESEIWGYLPSLLSAHNRRMYSAAYVRLRDEADPQHTLEQIEGPAIQLTGLTETAYWNSQAGMIRVYLLIVRGLVAVMALAAVFCIANTMFSAVAGRSREVAMLRTIGFSPGQILLGFVIEAVLLALLGGLAGCAACAGWLALVGNTKGHDRQHDVYDAGVRHPPDADDRAGGIGGGRSGRGGGGLVPGLARFARAGRFGVA